MLNIPHRIVHPARIGQQDCTANAKRRSVFHDKRRVDRRARKSKSRPAIGRRAFFPSSFSPLRFPSRSPRFSPRLVSHYLSSPDDTSTTSHSLTRSPSSRQRRQPCSSTSTYSSSSAPCSPPSPRPSPPSAAPGCSSTCAATTGTQRPRCPASSTPSGLSCTRARRSLNLHITTALRPLTERPPPRPPSSARARRWESGAGRRAAASRA